MGMWKTASLVGSALLLASSASAQVAVGDSPDYEFRGPLQNSMGVKSLADLRGKPVLVEYWGLN